MIKAKRVNLSSPEFPLWGYEVTPTTPVRVKGLHIVKFRITKNPTGKLWSLRGLEKSKVVFITLDTGFSSKKEALEDIEYRINN